jgi:thiol-disulfide isomerase/thioredoxin
VRTVVGVALVTVCLGLAGCSLFGKKQAALNKNSNPKPFLGSETPAKTDTAAIPKNNSGPLPGANGYLAGRVVVEATEEPIKRAYIRVIDPDEKDGKAAPLDVETDPSGFFTISGLKVGRPYELIARAEDGGQLISGKVYSKPPQVTLLILLDKRHTNPSTPPLPGAPTVPGKKNSESSGSSKDDTPAASIGRPEKIEPNAPPRTDLAAPTPAGGSGGSSDPGNPPNPANIADGGFRRIQPSHPVDIPSPPPWPPPVPAETQWEKAPEERQPRTTPAVPSSPGSVRLPNLPTPVPSCGFYGDHLDNFALRDLDGNVWEYKRNRRGRLMLLDFWFHTCHSCLLEMPHLVKLQRDYAPYGLEIVSIACEMGTVEEQRRNVRAIRGRYGLNYLTLLSGGGPEHCPVIEQFQVRYYPLLVLIDADGKILWRSPERGMDDNQHYVLWKMIDERLVTRRPSP